MKEIIPLVGRDNSRLPYFVNPITLAAMDIYRAQDAILVNAKLKEHIQIETFLSKEEAQKWLLH